jgi:AcrR family transcriptional regulator
LKEKIIETSLQLFLKHGIRKMTVKQLVKPLGISLKTVYRYFPGKEDLLKECLVVHYEALQQNLKAVTGAEQNPVLLVHRTYHEAIGADFGVNHIFYHDLNYYYPQLQDTVLKKIFGKHASQVEEMIRSGIKKGYFKSDIHASVAAKVLGILYSSITRTGEFKKLNLSPDTILHNTLDAYLCGICTEKGLKILKPLLSH